MSKDPAILLYSGDFLNGCSCLTMEERGQYITMLCLQHQVGHLSEKTIRLSVGLVSVDVLKKFTQDAEGNFYNERMDKEIEKRAQFIESRRVNGNKGGRPVKIDLKPSVKPSGLASENLGDNDNEDIINNINVPFENFWNLYDKKRGDKEKLAKKWESLSSQDRLDIMAYIPKYKLSTPDKSFRKDPQTFFNNRSWNDEIITTIPIKNNGSPVPYAGKTFVNPDPH